MPESIGGDNELYWFDDVKVDRVNFHVEKNGETVALKPRNFDVLVYLIRNAGRVVEKQELFEQVWKETFVSDNALTKIIKEIRHALGDAASDPQYIETIPKRGYRFIAEIKTAAAGDATKTTPIDDNKENDLDDETLLLRPSRSKVVLLSTAGLIAILVFAALLWFRQPKPTTPADPIRSIAVLPFKPLDADSRDESLEMGMAETLITRLSNLEQIVVRPTNAGSNNSDLQQDPVKAGHDAQAEAVLDGSIQKAGERIRVTARLTDVRNGRQLWSEQFDERFTDIFKVQDAIAERITNALTLQLSRREKEQLAKHYTDDPQAYQLYLQGQLLWHRRRQDWIRQSLEYYQQALAKDPDFALAHIGVADSYIMLNGHHAIPATEAEAKARESIERALAIDATLPQAHNALAELKYQYEYDWAGAEEEFKKAIGLNPNLAWIRQAYGWFLMSESRFDEAAGEMERARELDPASLTINVGRGRLFYFSRQYDRAIQHLENIIAVEPEEESSYAALTTIYEQKKMYPEALEAVLKIRSLHGAKPEEIEEYRETFRVSGWTGFLRKQLERLEKKVKTGDAEPYMLATFYARLGMRDQAFVALEKTEASHDPSIIQAKIDPQFDSLRDDPRYTRLIRKIGLEP